MMTKTLHSERSSAVSAEALTTGVFDIVMEGAIGLSDCTDDGGCKSEPARPPALAARAVS